MKPIYRTAAAAIAATVMASAAMAAPIARAGEWQTVIEGRSTYVCLSQDRAYDADSLARSTSAIPGAQCSVADYRSAGAVTSFTMACSAGAARLTTHNTLTVTGDQAYTLRVTSHLDGGAQAVPDHDVTQVAHRTGDCQPRDTRPPS